MQSIKNICKEVCIYAFRILGYEVHRSSEVRVTFDNFLDLVKAYEHRLNESENLIVQNDIRPKLLARLLGTPPAEAYFIVQSLAKTKHVRGSVCEFGIAQGETSALLANEISSGDKILHLFDSFQGLPEPSEKDRLKDDISSLGDMKHYTGKMYSPERMVQTRLKAISFPSHRFVIHKGFIEQVFRHDANLPKEVSFAYVDFDFYEPIKLALDFLHHTTLPGAIIIVDDYDFFSTGCKTAVDEFLKDKNLNNMIYECLIPSRTHYGSFAVLTKKGS